MSPTDSVPCTAQFPHFLSESHHRRHSRDNPHGICSVSRGTDHCVRDSTVHLSVKQQNLQQVL